MSKMSGFNDFVCLFTKIYIAIYQKYVVFSTPRAETWCKMISAAFRSCFRMRKPIKNNMFKKKRLKYDRFLKN